MIWRDAQVALFFFAIFSGTSRASPRSLKFLHFLKKFLRGIDPHPQYDILCYVDAP